MQRDRVTVVLKPQEICTDVLGNNYSPRVARATTRKHGCGHCTHSCSRRSRLNGCPR